MQIKIFLFWLPRKFTSKSCKQQKCDKYNKFYNCLFYLVTRKGMLCVSVEVVSVTGEENIAGRNFPKNDMIFLNMRKKLKNWKSWLGWGVWTMLRVFTVCGNTCWDSLSGWSLRRAQMKDLGREVNRS